MVEAIGDFVVILNSVLATSKTVLCDIVSGIATGNWDWSTTKKMWSTTKTIVAYNWTNKIFDAFYDTSLGKKLDEYAYSPFKSDGMGCQIINGVGYVAGVVVLTIVTAGAFGAATAAGSAASTAVGVTGTQLAATATAAGIGKYTAEEWNKNGISINYNGTDLNITIDYEKYSEIEKLNKGESTTLTHQITNEDGTIQDLVLKITSIGNGEYTITDAAGNTVQLNNLEESNTAKGLGIGIVKGGWEGLQYYVGGKIGTGQFTSLTKNLTKPVLQTAVRSGTRVALDVGTGVVEVPFQSLVTMLSEGKTWNEAWAAQGGWDAVKSQAAIAGIASFGGEALDVYKLFKNTDNISKSVVSTTIDNQNKVTKNIANTSSVKSLDEQIALANYYAQKGNFYEIKVNNLDDLPSNFYNNLAEPTNVKININGQIMDSQKVDIFKSLGISDIGILTQIKNNPVNFYLDNIQKLNKIGLSFDDCVQIFDININKYGIDDSLAAAVAYNDKNIFLTTKCYELEQKGLLEPKDIKKLSNLINQPSANINPEDLQKALSKYLTTDEIKTLKTINDSGKMNLSGNEAAALYQYQAAGGNNVAMYNRGNTDFNHDLSLKTIEHWMNDQQRLTGVVRNLNAGTTIVEEIDSAIMKNTNKQTVTAVRYVNDVGPDLDLTPILNGTVDPHNLVGLSFDDLANTSYTILENKTTYYSAIDPQTNQLRNKIKIEAVLPQGTGAFIDSQGGLPNYTLMEFLAKRNTKNNIVNAYWDIDGRLVLQTLVTTN